MNDVSEAEVEESANAIAWADGLSYSTASAGARDRYRRLARAALTATQARERVLPGWRLVPEKLTREMACALEDCAPPDAWVNGDPHGAIDQLLREYQPEWDRVLTASPVPALTASAQMMERAGNIRPILAGGDVQDQCDELARCVATEPDQGEDKLGMRKGE